MELDLLLYINCLFYLHITDVFLLFCFVFFGVAGGGSGLLLVLGLGGGLYCL